MCYHCQPYDLFAFFEGKKIRFSSLIEYRMCRDDFGLGETKRMMHQKSESEFTGINGRSAAVSLSGSPTADDYNASFIELQSIPVPV